jgi:hypothetical protein
MQLRALAWVLAQAKREWQQALVRAWEDSPDSDLDQQGCRQKMRFGARH